MAAPVEVNCGVPATVLIVYGTSNGALPLLPLLAATAAPTAATMKKIRATVSWKRVRVETMCLRKSIGVT
jgi:hypothetical protein